MDETEYHWRASDGVRLYAVKWRLNDPRRRVVLVHGLGEHITRYRDVAGVLTAHGSEVSGFDFRGHGNSEGARGDASSFERLITDLEEYVSDCAMQTGLPVHLYGHSMGGNVVLNYALRRRSDVRSLVVTSPGLKPASVATRFALKLGAILKPFAGRLIVSNGIDVSYLSRRQDVVQDYERDPLNHDRISVRLALSLIEAGDYACRNAARLRKPLLLLQGTDDRVVDITANLTFARLAGHYCQLELLPGLYHELHHEPERNAVLERIACWLSS